MDPNACGYTLSYTANVIAADGTSSAITTPPFALSGTDLTVQAVDTTYVNSYTINIVASLTDGTIDSSLKFVVFIYPSGLTCGNDQVDDPNALPNFTYSLGVTGDLMITPTFTHKNLADR